MNQLQIDIALLFIISFSATVVGYLLYIEYKRLKHINRVKEMISLEDDEFEQLLDTHKKDEEQSGWKERLSLLIIKSGFAMPNYLFILIFLLFISTAGVLFFLFLHHIIGFVFGAMFGTLIFVMFIQSRILKRKKEFNRALATAISVLVKMMKNGIGFEQGLVKSITVSNSKVLKGMFENFFQEKNTIGEVKAFENLSRLIDSKELLVFALAIKIGRASGGQFSNTLEKVEKTIQYRKKMQDKVDVITREGAVGSYVVVGISIFLYFSLNGNFDGRLHHYFMESEYGRFQLLGIVMWVFIGMVVNKIITRVDK